MRHSYLITHYSACIPNAVFDLLSRATLQLGADEIASASADESASANADERAGAGAHRLRAPRRCNTPSEAVARWPPRLHGRANGAGEVFVSRLYGLWSRASLCYSIVLNGVKAKSAEVHHS